MLESKLLPVCTSMGRRLPVYADSLISRGLIGRDFPQSWAGAGALA